MMDILGKIGAYLIAYILVRAIELVFYPISFLILRPLRRVKSFSPLLMFVYDSSKACITILLAGWLIREIGQTPSWLMFLIPGYFVVWNAITRLNLAKAGLSNVRSMLAQNNEPESYNQKHDILIERAYVAGSYLGLTIGTNIVVQPFVFF